MFTSHRNLKMLYSNIFASYIGCLDLLWFTRVFSGLSKIYGYKFTSVENWQAAPELSNRQSTEDHPEHLDLDIYYIFHQKYGIQLQNELQMRVRLVRELNLMLERLFFKTANYKANMLGFIENLQWLNKVSQKYVFFFDKHHNLMYLNGMPKQLISSGQSDKSMLNSQTKFENLFQSTILKKHVKETVDGLLDHKMISDFFDHPNIGIKLIKKGFKGGYKGFSMIIDEATLVRLEENPHRAEDQELNIMEQKDRMQLLKQTRKRKIGFISADNNGLNLQHENRENWCSTEGEEPVFEVPASRIFINVDHSNNKDVSFKFQRKKMNKAWTLHHSINEVPSGSLSRNLDVSRTLKDSESQAILIKEVSKTYAMEYFPDNMNNLLTANNWMNNLSLHVPLEKSKSGLSKSRTNLLSEKFSLDAKAYEEVTKSEPAITESMLNNWNLDILKLSAKEELALAMKLFRPYFSDLKVNPELFFRYITSLKHFYNKKNNPFHNFHHGVSVAFSSSYIMARLPQVTGKLDRHIQFAFTLACLGHDVGHTGKNNNYEINSQSKLAMRYNDRSPLEQHHIAKMFSIVHKFDINVFESFSVEEYNEMRNTIIECILATDMKVHFSLLAKFDSAIKSDDKLPFKEMKELSLCMLIHAADISMSTRRIDLATQWSQLVAQEFSSQYNLEVEQKIPVTAYFKDLHIPLNFYKSEVGFLNFIVKPLFNSLKSYDFNLDAGVTKAEKNNIQNSDEDSRIKSEANGTEAFSNPFREITASIEENIAHYEKLVAKENELTKK